MTDHLINMVIACTRDCYDTCIFDESYRPLNIFPINGFTCARGKADLIRNERNRVTSAYIDGKEVSIDEAIKYVAKLFREVIKRDPARILRTDYDGNQSLLTWYFPDRLFNVIGASQTDRSICSAEGHAAIRAHYGTSMGALPEDFVEYRAAVFWAFPASVSAPHIWALFIKKFKVAIDVRLSDTARKSDRAIIVRPGTDVFLALGVIKVLIEEGLVEGRVRHFEDLAGYVGKFSLDYLSRISGVPIDDIRWLAEFYHDYKPLTLIGFALGRSLNGGDAIGMISLIPALVGLERGYYYSNSLGWGIDFDYLRGLHMAKSPRVIPMADFGDYIERGEVDIVYAWNENPVVTLPGGDKLIEAVRESRATLIVHDPYWSETAKLANVVIPAPTFLEKYDVVYGYWHDYLVYNEPIKSPRGITEVDLVRRLAKELGISHPLLLEDPWDAVDKAIRPTGITLGELRDRKVVRIKPRYLPANEPDALPLPNPVEPSELSSNEVRLVFTSHPLYTNTQFREVYGNLESVVYTHDYEGVFALENEFGVVRVRAVRDSNVPSGVALIYKSSLIDLDGKPINALTGRVKGRYAGTPLLNGVKVRIKKLFQ
ncbi:dehydrogenase [Vulcanisaeta souniana JCM 11219]|uniref:Dehydrogenase n=2 Tax=Vulcanisaeta souniana JCM 11219 TaxID=1293586 RepID=A0A830DZJ7_9CREN|nr:molybdopterin-dependent oxidoreductase [Vulcanisaeta souniana]GGI72214.1 dehydrogenase [Vulcanisaeta souniana JCM 11219]